MESRVLCSRPMSLMASGQFRLGHYYYTAQPCSTQLTVTYVRHLPSLLTITYNFVSLHKNKKKTKSVNLCSAQLISAQLRRAHGSGVARVSSARGPMLGAAPPPPPPVWKILHPPLGGKNLQHEKVETQGDRGP